MRQGAAGALRPILLVLGVAQLALAALMVISPGTFFDQVGPYGPRNDHYIRDAATFAAPLGIVALVAARRPGWRVPVLAYATLQYGFHAVNHLVDIGDADPKWLGPVNFAALAVGAAVLGWALLVAAREQAAHQ